jgi:hypothetical protein
VPSGTLVAVDLGYKTGLAVYAADGRLQAYRSQNYGTRERLKRGAASALDAVSDLRWLAVEGDAALGRVWGRAAERRGAVWTAVAPEQWRAVLLHPHERRTGASAKQHADRLARMVIDWSDAPKPTALRHDAAEAILAGLWACVHYGLLDALPEPLQLQRRR